MSTEYAPMKSGHPGAVTAPDLSWRQDLRTVRVVRLAMAATLAMVVAQLFAWPLSYAAPALVVAFLEMPIPEPDWRDFFSNLGYAVLSVVGVFVFVMLFEPYPLIFMFAYIMAIFLTAYFLHQGAPFVLILFTFLGLMIFPIVGNVHEGLTLVLAGDVLLSEIVAVIVIQLAHGIFPDPPGTERAESPIFQSGYSAHAARCATVTTVVILPAMMAFLMFNWPAQLVIMLYIGLISLEGSLAHSLYDMTKYLAANAVGGIGALLFYLVILVVPEVPMLVLLTLFTTLLFSARRFSDAADAKYFGSALIGLLILISNSVGPGANIDVNIITRIAFIIIAGIYVIGVMSIVDSLLDRFGMFGGHEE